MSVNVQEWSSNYEAIKSKINGIRREGLSMSAAESSTVRASIDRLSAQLRMMRSAPSEYEISMSELARRDVLLKNLQSSLSKASNNSFSNMTAVLGANSGAGSINSITMNNKSNKGNNSSTINPMLNNTSDSGLVQRQEMIMKQQDQMLGEISVGVDRLKHKAGAINQEVNLQGRLLEDLEEHVEAGITGLHEEAEHAAKVREKSRIYSLYICLVLEFIVLLILIFITFMK